MREFPAFTGTTLMAKCVHCGQKKGKRHCPALEDGICAQCCATHRLKTIQCPADCVHLQSEFYQQGRRSQKAQSAGKKFLDRTSASFHSEEAQSFAFMVQADLYWWCSRHDALANEEIARILKATTADPDCPTGDEDDLADFIRKLFSRSQRYSNLEKNGFDQEQKKKVIEALASCARNHADGESGKESQSYLQELSDYFDQLDFEADLDYSPTEELAEETPPTNGEEEQSAEERDLTIPEQ